MLHNANQEQHHQQPLDDGIIQAVWLTPDELAASGRARSPLVLQCIQDYLAGQALPLSVIYEHPAST